MGRSIASSTYLLTTEQTSKSDTDKVSWKQISQRSVYTAHQEHNSNSCSFTRFSSITSHLKQVFDALVAQTSMKELTLCIQLQIVEVQLEKPMPDQVPNQLWQVWWPKLFFWCFRKWNQIVVEEAKHSSLVMLGGSLMEASEDSFSPRKTFELIHQSVLCALIREYFHPREHHKIHFGSSHQQSKADSTWSCLVRCSNNTHLLWHLRRRKRYPITCYLRFLSAHYPCSVPISSHDVCCSLWHRLRRAHQTRYYTL